MKLMMALKAAKQKAGDAWSKMGPEEKTRRQHEELALLSGA